MTSEKGYLLYFVGLKINVTENDSSKSVKCSIPYETFQKGTISDVDEGIQAATKIGFPIMIKASEGGGGKGIRKSTSVDDFPNLFRQVYVLYCLIVVCFVLLVLFFFYVLNRKIGISRLKQPASSIVHKQDSTSYCSSDIQRNNDQSSQMD